MTAGHRADKWRAGRRPAAHHVDQGLRSLPAARHRRRRTDQRETHHRPPL